MTAYERAKQLADINQKDDQDWTYKVQPIVEGDNTIGHEVAIFNENDQFEGILKRFYNDGKEALPPLAVVS